MWLWERRDLGYLRRHLGRTCIGGNFAVSIGTWHLRFVATWFFISDVFLGNAYLWKTEVMSSLPCADTRASGGGWDEVQAIMGGAAF